MTNTPTTTADALKPSPAKQRQKPRPIDRRSGVWLLQTLVLLIIAQIAVFHHTAGAGLAAFLLIALVVSTLKYRATNSFFLGFAATASILLIVESADFLTISLALVLIGLFALDRADRLPRDDWDKVGAYLARYVAGPVLAIPEILSGFRLFGQLLHVVPNQCNVVRQWIAPAGLVVVFLWLFLPANPWLAIALEYINPARWLALPDLSTVLMWLLTALLIWPLLTIEMKRRRNDNHRIASLTGSMKTPFRNNRTAALILFNGVFLLQTSNDLTNLWPGLVQSGDSVAFLPEGMTYAEFAKAGAYPLLIATLLAAAIILALLREDNETVSGRYVIPLIVLWVLQTIVLLASSAARLDLYVDAYGLTRLRLYTFIGMGLIAVGLAMVLWRIAASKSNRWLTRRCLLTATTAAFACGALNLDGYIARNNLARIEPPQRQEPASSGVLTSLDIDYLCDLGDGALTAIADFIEDNKRLDLWNSRLGYCLRWQMQELKDSQSDWQSWGWRKARVLKKVTPIMISAKLSYKAGPATNDTVEDGAHTGRR